MCVVFCLVAVYWLSRGSVPMVEGGVAFEKPKMLACYQTAVKETAVNYSMDEVIFGWWVTTVSTLPPA